jgi:hypothetical protein
MGLNRLIGPQKKGQANEFSGLRRLFEMGYISSPSTLASIPIATEGTMVLKNMYACEALPADGLPGRVASHPTEGATETDTALLPIVPEHWVVAMRLALVSFMATAWFLSRSYTITMYLVLGLATATIALQRSKSKSLDRVHWIFSTVTIEVVMIIVIYGLVRFRH